MSIPVERKLNISALVLGIFTLIAVAALMMQDAVPSLFQTKSHEGLSAFSLAAIGFAYLVHEFAHRREPGELIKAILLVAAFLFWAANQMWPNLPQAAFFNDIAVALFVLDVFLAIAGWPAGRKEMTVFGDSPSDLCRCGGECCCCSGSPAKG